jgi:hypothetical protein
MTISKKNRCLSGHADAHKRLVWIGSALKKCCGVWTIPTSGSANSPQKDEVRPPSGREGVRDAVVHIARFRMFSLDSEDIMRAQLMREIADGVTRAIVEKEDAKIGMVVAIAPMIVRSSHGLFRFLDKVAEAFATHRGVESIAAERSAWRLSKPRDWPGRSLELRRGARLMLRDVRR